MAFAERRAGGCAQLLEGCAALRCSARPAPCIHRAPHALTSERVLAVMDNFKYAKSHEARTAPAWRTRSYSDACGCGGAQWVKVEGDVGTVGITDHAQARCRSYSTLHAPHAPHGADPCADTACCVCPRGARLASRGARARLRATQALF